MDVSRAARAAQPAGPPGPVDLLLDGLAVLVTDGRPAATPLLAEAVGAFVADKVSVEEWLHWGVLAASAAVTLWDFESWSAVVTRQVELARGVGVLAPLSIKPEREPDRSPRGPATSRPPPPSAPRTRR